MASVDEYEEFSKEKKELEEEMNMPPLYVKSLENAFCAFDPEADGTIDRSMIQRLYDKVGERYTKRDLDCIFRRFSSGKSKKEIPFKNFCHLLHNELQADDQSAFQTYINICIKKQKVEGQDETDDIVPLQLRKALKRIGERLSTEEAREMLRFANNEEEILDAVRVKK
eukprot:g840.t1